MSLGDRCMACGSSTTLPVIPPDVPRINIESLALDATPFSESFSGLFEEHDNDDDENDDQAHSVNLDDLRTNRHEEMSYYVEQFSDVKELDSEWDDDDVEEIMVLSPKQKHSKLPTISEEHDTLSLVSNVSNEARRSGLLPPAECSVALADFDLIPTSGYPMLCRKRSTSKVYVIKALNPGMHTEKVVMERIRDLCAPFLEHLHWSFPEVADGEVSRAYLVLDSNYQESLSTLVKSRPLPSSDALFYACEIVDAISSLHAAKIIHRDISPSNIFLDDVGHVVLSNFCNATILSPDAQYSSPPSAAVEYQAPEVLLGWAHEFAVDCWSFGLLLHFLLAGTNPFAAGKDDLRGKILGREPALDGILPEPKDLIKKCLERNPALRLSIGGIRDHVYFGAVDWLNVRARNLRPPIRSRTSSPKLRPLSQDFPLPPTCRVSHCLDASFDLSFTVQTASKAIPSLPRLERVDALTETTSSATTRPLFRSCSMDDIRARFNSKRLSLNIPSSSVRVAHHRSSRSIHDRRPSSLRQVDSKTVDSAPAFPPRLSLQIQTPDQLPTIFRPTPLDDRLVEEEEPTQLSPAISSPTVCEPSPRERMTHFWARLDREEEQQQPTPPPQSLELLDAIRLALPCPPLPIPQPAHRLRRHASSAALPPSQTEQRLSMLSSPTPTSTKLRKLRRPLSTPLIPKRSDPILNLPIGVEQIGKGIGFTYKIPAASYSRASIRTTSATAAASRLLRGLGKSLLRRVKSSPKFPPSSSPSLARRRGRGPPAPIQTGLTRTMTPNLQSPASTGPLTPESPAFPPMPEILGDPFAKDKVEEVRYVGTSPTLRLVTAAAPSEHKLPPCAAMDNVIFSNGNV